MKHLTIFETQAAYSAAESNLILPNVSLITADGDVKYKAASPTPPTPSHDFVEIGGLKWATMNVGANSITDTGLYFQWGDTRGYTAAQVGSGSGQKAFTWDDYKYTNDGGSTMTKYNESDERFTLESSDDPVTAAWGGNWRMPTTEQFDALDDAVTTAWTQVNGVYGLQCTDKTDSTKVLFFPAAGYCIDGGVDGVGDYGSYWSSSLYADYGDSGAYRLLFDSGNVDWQGGYDRYFGLSVRGVVAEN